MQDVYFIVKRHSGIATIVAFIIRDRADTMITYNLAGRAGLVTGGASGIGLATATMLARAGAAVALNFRPGDTRGTDAAARLRAKGCKIIEAEGSVSVPDQAERLPRPLNVSAVLICS